MARYELQDNFSWEKVKKDLKFLKAENDIEDHFQAFLRQETIENAELNRNFARARLLVEPKHRFLLLPLPREGHSQIKN